MANTNLKEAKAAKNDEFYTQFHDIEVETNTTLTCSGAKPYCCLAMTPNGATSPASLQPSSMSWD